jgi:ribosomal protein L3 glutamine methyltransferase
MNAPSLTVLTLIQTVSERLDAAGLKPSDGFGHGTQTAFDEAAWLVMWRLGLPLDDLDGVAERVVSAEEASQVSALVEERIRTRQPAAYLTHEAWLQGVPFYVDERVIMPRSFIAELLADGSIDPWLSRRHTPRARFVHGQRQPGRADRHDLPRRAGGRRRHQRGCAGRGPHQY